MNSRNKIILGCLSFLVIVSVGYALFSEKIIINGSAKAKSDMDVAVTQCKQYGVNLTEEEIKASGEEQLKPGDSIPNIEKYGNASCNIEDDGIIKTTSLLNKPTDGVYFSIFIKDKGKVAVKVKEINSNNNYGRQEPYDEVYYDGYTGEGIDFPKGSTGLVAGYSFMELTSDGLVKYPGLSPYESPYNYQSDSSIENANVIIPSGQSVYILIYHTWADNIVNPPKEGLKMNYDIQFVFEQVA